MKTHWTRPQFHEVFINLTRNIELLAEFTVSNLRYILKEIEHELRRCKENPNHIFPSLAIVTKSKFKSSDFILEEDRDTMVKLRRKGSFKFIEIVKDNILLELDSRNKNIESKSLELNSGELADIANKYSLLQVMDKTEVVNMFCEIRELKKPPRPQNLSLYKKL